MVGCQQRFNIHLPSETAETPRPERGPDTPALCHWAAMFCVTLTCPFRRCGDRLAVRWACWWWRGSTQVCVVGHAAQASSGGSRVGASVCSPTLGAAETGQEDNLPWPMEGPFRYASDCVPNSNGRVSVGGGQSTPYARTPHTWGACQVWVVVVEGCIAGPIPADHQSLPGAHGGHRHLRHGRAWVSGPWLWTVSSFPASWFVLASRRTTGNVVVCEGGYGTSSPSVLFPVENVLRPEDTYGPRYAVGSCVCTGVS